MIECENCKGYPIIDKRISDVERFKDRLEGNDGAQGILDRIWIAIECKISRGVLLIVAGIIIGFIGVLFGLVYNSNQSILNQFGDIKKDIAVISKVVELKTTDRGH